MKIFTVVGARPQFIKAAVVSKAISAKDELDEILVHTGQHFENNMSQVFFDQMGLPPAAFNLGINTMSHGKMTGRMLEGLEKLMMEQEPDMVLVYGDTNSTLAGALAASKLHIPVAHVEAGLRSYNMQMPEEVNRVLTDKLSSLLFCPTKTAIDNLEKEGFKNSGALVKLCGDVMFDASRQFSDTSTGTDISVPDHEYVLATIHRQENISEPHKLEEIVSALNEIHQQVPVCFPVHPHTAKKLKGLKVRPDFNTMEPLGYLEMLKYLKGARLIFTDSGGLQKEAYFFGKYCLTIRSETEWKELVDQGYNYLSGWKRGDILKTFSQLLKQKEFSPGKLYGNGKASLQIADEIYNFLKA